MTSDWFSSAIDELKLPGSPWYHVSDVISKNLAYRIRLEGLTFNQLEKVSKFVGREFMKKYHLVDLFDSFNPTTNKSSRLTTDVEVQNLLKELTLKAAADSNCSMPINSSSSIDFVEVLSMVTSVYRNKISEECSKHINTAVNKRNTIGEKIVSILKMDPASLNKVSCKLNGQSLPTSLRLHIYRLILIKKWRISSGFQSATVNHSMETIEQKLRDEFATKLKRNMVELKVTNPIESPLAYLIVSSLKTVLEATYTFQPYLQDTVFQRDCARSLNILYIRKKQFESVYTYWCIPLVVVFREQSVTKQIDFEMAMWLNILISECIPSKSALNDIVISSWVTASKHSTKVFSDFEFEKVFKSLGIEVGEESVKDILSNLQQCDTTDRMKMYFHPVLLIRQWVLNLFVGYLDFPSVLFIWDQLFLCSWSRNCFIRSCLVLFSILAKTIRGCSNRDELLEQFNTKLSSLQRQDIAAAWKRLNDFSI